MIGCLVFRVLGLWSFRVNGISPLNGAPVMPSSVRLASSTRTISLANRPAYLQIPCLVLTDSLRTRSHRDVFISRR